MSVSVSVDISCTCICVQLYTYPIPTLIILFHSMKDQNLKLDSLVNLIAWQGYCSPDQIRYYPLVQSWLAISWSTHRRLSFDLLECSKVSLSDSITWNMVRQVMLRREVDMLVIGKNVGSWEVDKLTPYSSYL